MTYGMGAAAASLIGVFVSAYLWLHKIGFIGTMVCSTGGCRTVQFSPYSMFLGVDVALIGLVGYVVLLVVSLVAIHPTYADARRPAAILLGLSAGAVLFTARLKYLEFFVIGAVCQW
ncbi:MAG: hypothetical protein E4G90_03330, partial [Gemmatimonadales bacterium]